MSSTPQVGVMRRYWVLIGTVFPESSEPVSVLRQGSTLYELDAAELSVAEVFTTPQTLESASDRLGLDTSETLELVGRFESIGVLVRVDPPVSGEVRPFDGFRLVPRAADVESDGKFPDPTMTFIRFDGERVEVTAWTASVIAAGATNASMAEAVDRIALEGRISSVEAVWSLLIQELPWVLGQGVAFLDRLEHLPTAVTKHQGRG